MAEPQQFDPDGDGYDYLSAEAIGMKPNKEGHWGSVAPVPLEIKQALKLPEESYVLLKGRKHKTWKLAVDAEQERGFKVIKLGPRYYSVPEEWMP